MSTENAEKDLESILTSIRQAIVSNPYILNRIVIDRILKEKTENIVGYWLGNEDYHIRQRAAALERGHDYIWMPLDNESMQRRLHIIKKLKDKKNLHDKLIEITQETLLAFQDIYDNPEKLYKDRRSNAKATKIGKKLCKLTKTITGKKDLDILLLFNTIIYKVYPDVATQLSFGWTGICGWLP